MLRHMWTFSINVTVQKLIIVEVKGCRLFSGDHLQKHSPNKMRRDALYQT